MSTAFLGASTSIQPFGSTGDPSTNPHLKLPRPEFFEQKPSHAANQGSNCHARSKSSRILKDQAKPKEEIEDGPT
jgi:hypothetical protein